MAVVDASGKSYAFEDIEVDMAASLSRTVSKDDILSFAEITGDFNPMHVDEVYAAKTPFKGCISHGMLTASYISAVFGMRLPGPGAIYISQTLNFHRPVHIGDTVTTTVRVAEMLPSHNRVMFDCVCQNGAGKAVLEGEAVLMVPSRS